MSAYHHTKEDGSNKEILILQYNLDERVHKQYQDLCQEVNNTLCWYYHTEYTYDLDTPDAGAGNQIKFWFRFYLAELL